MMWFDGMGWWMIFGGIWTVLIGGGIIALIVWVVKKITEGGGSSRRSDPLGIAKERYAKGEISQEEFEEIKKGLS
ncbi:SHOCT domain-containing protein [Chloroflexota bacterium]